MNIRVTCTNCWKKWLDIKHPVLYRRGYYYNINTRNINTIYLYHWFILNKCIMNKRCMRCFNIHILVKYKCHLKLPAVFARTAACFKIEIYISKHQVMSEDICTLQWKTDTSKNPLIYYDIFTGRIKPKRIYIHTLAFLLTCVEF